MADSTTIAGTDLQLSPLAVDIVSRMANGRGFSSWWEYHGTRITPDQLRSIVSAAGGDVGRVRDIDPIAALRQAVKDWNKQEVRQDLSMGLSFTLRTKVNSRVVSEEGDLIYVGITGAVNRGPRETGDDQRELLVYCRSTHTWQTTPATGAGPQDAESKFAKSIKTLVKRRQNYYDGSAVVAHVIMPCIQECKAAFHMKKGWWFMPSEHAAKYAEVQKALAGVETFQLHVGGVPAGIGFEPTLHRGARENLGTEIESLTKLVDGWVDMTRRVRSDTKASVMERFDSINDRLTLYTATLEVSLSDLKDKAGELRSRAQEVITSKDAEFGGPLSSGGGKPRNSSRMATIQSMPPELFKQAWDGFCLDSNGSVRPMPTDRDEACTAMFDAMRVLDAA